MPHTPDEHDFDIQKPYSLPKETKPVSHWRNQMGNKSVDLRAFAPKPSPPVQETASPRQLPEIRIPEPFQQLSRAEVQYEEIVAFDKPTEEAERNISDRDRVLRELEEIEREHEDLRSSIGPLVAEKTVEEEYRPWTSLPDRQSPLEHNDVLASLSVFAAPSARPHVPARQPAYNFIPAPQESTHFTTARSQNNKKKRHAGKSFIGFAAFLALAIFGAFVWQRSQGLEGQVAPELLQAYGQLEQAKADLTALKFAEASSEFSFAEEKFTDAENTTESVGGPLLASAVAASPIPNKARSGIHLIAAGREFSRAGADLSHAAFLIASSNQSTTSASFASVFSESMREFSDAQTQITQAQGDLALVRIEDIPTAYQTQFSDALAKLNDANSIFQSLGPISDALTTFAGMQNEKSYLLLFQNPAEIRATGGFLGTYGIVKIEQGQVKTMTADGVYDADGQLTTNVVPPYPVETVSTGWSMHDANWFFDFPTSAQKVQWFYEKTGGETTDGVVAVTPKLIEDLLKITGPISMPDYNTTLSADNFEDVVQQQVEVKYDKTQNKPKKILADFMPVFLAKVQDALPTHASDIMQIVTRNLQQKDILLYSRDQNVEQVLDRQGWSGRVSAPVSQGAQDLQDFLGVVQTNLGGYKTDRVVRTTEQSATTLASDGSIHRTVTITRTHQGGKSAYDYYNKPNIDYMRLYVPEGAQLISATGFSPQPNIPAFDYAANNFSTDATIATTGLGDKKDSASNTDIFQENGMQVFGNWLVLNPGETKTVQIEYVLPNTFTAPSSYSLTMFSQAGISPVLGVSLDATEAGSISSCSQGTYDSNSLNVQKVAFSSNTKITCVVGR